MDELKKDKQGLIRTGEFTSVNPQFLSQAGLQQAQTFAGIPQTISSATLSGNPTPVNLPEVPVSTLSAGITGQSPAIIEQQKLNQQVAQDKSNKQMELDSQKNLVRSTIDKITGVQTERANAEGDINTAGTPAWQKEQARQYSLGLDKSQRAQLNEQNAISSQSMLTDVQKQQKNNEISRRYALEQGDLQLKYHIASSDYNSAEETLNKKFELQLEPLKTLYKYQSAIYSDLQGSLTKAEDRQFQSLISQSDNAVKTAQENQKAITDIFTTLQTNNPTVLTNNPNLAVKLSNAKSPTEALQLLANAGVSLADPLDRQIKQAKLQTDAKEAIKKLSEPTQGTGELAQAQAKGNIDLVSGLASDKYLSSAVGPNVFGRISLFNKFTGGKNNFIAGVEQLSSQLSLDSLIRAKANGATFGALSDSELKILSASASKLGTWAVKDGEGNVTGYKTSEGEFKKELDKINNFAKLDYLIKGGSIEDVGAQQMDDGTIWVANSDGSFTQIYP